MQEGPDHGSLIELIVRWHVLVEQGGTPTPEELCQHCPELAPALRAYVCGPTSDSQAATETAGKEPDRPECSLGRYRLRRMIGCGAFGQVWQAYDPDLQRLVAVKIARPDRLAAPERRDQFLREARRLAQLSQQQGIVSVYDVGHVGELCFIVSELMPGGSLTRRLESADRWPLADAVAVVAEVAEALHEAHLSGIVHRDVKPANILFDGDGRAHLADFGLATSEEEQLQERRGVMGTWSYMSPEQARGESHLVDGRADIYSLGVVFYQLLTGRLPFVAQSKAEYLRQVVDREPRPARSVDDDIPPELERICLKCLARVVNDRYTTAGDLAADLRSWLAAQAAPASPRRLTPWIWSAATTAALVVTIGAAILVWQWWRPKSPTQMWQDLGKNTPVPVLLADGASWNADADRRETRIDSPGDFSFLSLGRSPGSQWRLECAVVGEPPADRAKPFGAGIFFGLHEERGPGGEVRQRMQAVFLIRDPSGANYHVQRRVIELRALPNGSRYAAVLPKAEAEAADVDDQATGEFALETGPSGLEIVTWRRQPARRLVRPEVNDGVMRDDYVGEYGILTFGGAATFGKARFKHLREE